MNTTLFKSVMVSNNDTQRDLANALHITLSNLNNKINGKMPFRQNEMNGIYKRYHLTSDQMVSIFFAE